MPDIIIILYNVSSAADDWEMGLSHASKAARWLASVSLKPSLKGNNSSCSFPFIVKTIAIVQSCTTGNMSSSLMVLKVPVHVDSM